MTADILPFPLRAVSSRLQAALAGAMHSCWRTHCGDGFDGEAVARLQRALCAQAIGRRETRHILDQVHAAQTWLEIAHRHACERASEDGEYVSATADIYARFAADITGGLGLPAMCADLLQPAEPVDIGEAWAGLELA